MIWHVNIWYVCFAISIQYNFAREKILNMNFRDTSENTQTKSLECESGKKLSESDCKILKIREGVKEKYHKTICWCVLKKHQLQWIKILCDLCCYYWEMTCCMFFFCCMKAISTSPRNRHFNLCKRECWMQVYDCIMNCWKVPFTKYIFLFSHRSELRVLMHFRLFFMKNWAIHQERSRKFLWNWYTWKEWK